MKQANLSLKEDLIRRSRIPKYSAQIVDLVERLAGEDFQKVGKKAIEFAADNRSIERAMADALDWAKKRVLPPRLRKKTASD